MCRNEENNSESSNCSFDIRNGKGEKMNNSIMNGIFWTYLERLCVQSLSFVTSIILARVLLPEYYGMIAVVTALTSIMSVFVDGGFSSALVQNKNTDNRDFNTIFVFSLTVSLGFYVILFCTSPLLAKLYKMSDLMMVIRVMAIRLPISSINAVQIAYLQKNEQYKVFFKATIVGTIISAFIGVIMAISGCGVWALVVQDIANITIDTIILNKVSLWKPKLEFSMDRILKMLPYGGKVFLTRLLNNGEQSLKSMIIGKFFSTSELAYYNKGEYFPGLIITNLNSSLIRVLLPTFAGKQDDRQEIKRILLKYISVALFITSPMLFGMAAVADNLVIIFLGEKWIKAIPFIKVMSLGMVFRTYITGCTNALLGIGKSDSILKASSTVNILSILYTFTVIIFKLPLYYIACYSIISSILCIGIFCKKLKDEFSVAYKEEMMVILPTIIACIIMYWVVINVGTCFENRILALFVEIIVGVFVYIMVALFMKNRGIKNIYEIIKNNKNHLKCY